MKRLSKLLCAAIVCLILVLLMPTRAEAIAGPEGETAYISINVYDESQYTFKWFYKDKGAAQFVRDYKMTGPTYTMEITKARSGRQVYCEIADNYGNVYETDVVTIALLEITKQPPHAVAKAGSEAKTTVNAVGDGLKFQWYVLSPGSDKIVKSSITGATYSTKMSNAKSGTRICCIITDEYGHQIATEDAILAVPAVITGEPKDAEAPEGFEASVKVTAVGEGLTYKWYYKNAGASKFIHTKTFTGDTYTAEMNDDRDGRQVYCVVTDQWGNTDKSATATLSMSEPIVITQEPKDVWYHSGANASVSVKAVGTGLKYQWYVRNPGAAKFVKSSIKSATYSTKMSTAVNGRQVYCEITNADGYTVKTKTATIYLKATISGNLSSQEVPAGETIKLTVNAVGDGLTYKWYYKNPNMRSFIVTNTFTGPTYTLKMDASRDGRQVYCEVTDKWGYKTKSNTATLSMYDGVSIYSTYADDFTQYGNTASVFIYASGKELTYAWYAKRPGDTEFTTQPLFDENVFRLEMTEETSGTQVKCVVADSYGNQVTSEVFTLRLRATLLENINDVSVRAGEMAKVTVKAVGEGLTYKWYYRNASGNDFSLTKTFTGPTYSAKMDKTRNGRQVYCIITDKWGNELHTFTATLSMYEGIKITEQYADDKVLSGRTASVYVFAEGQDLKYDWYVKMPGEEDFTLSQSNDSYVYTTDAMNQTSSGMQVKCVITDSYGDQVTSKVFTIYIRATITQNIQDVSVPAGEMAKVTLKAEGEGLTYKWYYANADSANFTLTKTFTGPTYSAKMDATRDGRQIYCEVTDKWGYTDQTAIVTLSIYKGPQIYSQYANEYISYGEDAVIDVLVADENVTYSWYVKMPGKKEYTLDPSYTSPTYVVEQFSQEHSGMQVKCVVADSLGYKTTSDEFTLRLRVTITKDLENVTVAAGEMARLTVSAVGEGLTYKWYYKNKDAYGFSLTDTFTGPTYSVQMDKTRHDRMVYCEITDKWGNTVYSTIANLYMK